MFNSMLPCWKSALAEELSLSYIKVLEVFLKQERASHCVFPSEDNVFSCFARTPLEGVRLVILGQDPYHQQGQAEGLCFSVPEGVSAPPSLKNIFKELERDLGVKKKATSLNGWASQGVLLLNSFLTVREGEPLSHAKSGWERFTDGAILALLKKSKKPLVFMLWGKQAEIKVERLLIQKQDNIFLLKASHPSPLSCYRGFNGCGHFSKANNFLTNWGESPLDFSA
jgi:uracil-DNA glycosylase